MKRTIFTLLFMIVAACSPKPESLPGYIPWEEAVTLIASGDVVSVAQAHSLWVDLWLKDGTSFHTVEPYIDAIYPELRKCVKCDEILIATE